MRSRSTRVEVPTTVEVDLTFSAAVTPSRPPPPCSNHDSPAFSDPGDPGEVDDVRIVLTSAQVRALREARYHEPNMTPHPGYRRPLSDLTDAQVAEFAVDVLRALGVETPDDDAFEEALSDGEPDEDVMRGEDR